MHEHLNDDDAERLLSGEATGDPLAATLESLRHHYRSVAPAVPGDALSEFVSVDLVAEFTEATDASLADAPEVADVIELPSPNKKDRKMSLSTLIGTAAGKVLIGATVAAASVGGVHAAGVIDVPILPDVEADEVDIVAGEPDVGDDALIEFGDDDDSDDDDSDDSDSDSDSDSDDGPDNDSDDDESDDDSDDDDSASGPATLLVIEPTSFDVLDGGSVTIQGDSVNGLVVVDATPADGWTAEIDASEEEGEAGVNFRRGDERVDFRAEIEDGHLRVRFRDRRTDSLEEVWFDEDGNVTTKPHSDDDSDDPDHDSDDPDDDSDDPDDDHSGSDSSGSGSSGSGG